jgi:hypothetical protein
MGQTVRFQEMLRRLAMIDEGFVEDQTRPDRTPARPGRDVGPGSQDSGAAASSGVGGHRVSGGLPAMAIGFSLAVAGALLLSLVIRGAGLEPKAYALGSARSPT